MSRRTLKIISCVAAMVMIAAIFTGCAENMKKNEHISMPAVIRGTDFCIMNAEGEYEPAFLDGVNIGAASVGNFPGEFGITKEEYIRWFGYIGDMNVRVIRVYVNQMPQFYEALYEYNTKAERPLYLIQGVYANEDLIARDMNAFDGEFQDVFFTDIRNAVDMIHGNCEIEKRPGNAGGTYTADVSSWVIGWILGIEWSADFVNSTNELNPDQTGFSGKYVYTDGASPFEVFLAETAETAIERDIEVYGDSRPAALCNWCTTDPLSHPNEPSPEMEDAVSVDTEHIRATDAYEAGFFASYHVYPYYPEFLSYDTKYLQGDDPDPYLAYLKELVSYHSVPVLVSEYGIPTSRGIAHKNAVTGMSQGFADERKQGEWLVSLNRDIRAAGCCGAIIFSWQDEWFKRNWNTMDYENPERRPFWYNVQCPEECFGILAFEPGEKESTVRVDGDVSEWKGDAPVSSQDGMEVYARCDEAYLYLMIRGDGWDFERDTAYVPIKTSLTTGSDHTADGLMFSDRANYLMILNGKEGSRVLTDAACDVFMYSYAHLHPFFEPVPGQYEKNSGYFNPIYIALNRPMFMPETGETTQFSRHETGLLRYGNAGEDSLSDICAGGDGVEIRLPWQLIGFMDPSTKQAVGDLTANSGDIPSETTDGIRVGASRDGNAVIEMGLFTWENWEMPVYRERLKASYEVLRDYFAQQQGE
ncbi:MAG: family 2 glycosyl transferase [Clostridia bacterium]|nr:family 2 glycosyl transferase [Clostridia bacterium]